MRHAGPGGGCPHPRGLDAGVQGPSALTPLPPAQLCLSLPKWPWASPSPMLRLGFLICKVGLILSPSWLLAPTVVGDTASHIPSPHCLLQRPPPGPSFLLLSFCRPSAGRPLPQQWGLLEVPTWLLTPLTQTGLPHSPAPTRLHGSVTLICCSCRHAPCSFSLPGLCVSCSPDSVTPVILVPRSETSSGSHSHPLFALGQHLSLWRVTACFLVCLACPVSRHIVGTWCVC